VPKKGQEKATKKVTNQMEEKLKTHRKVQPNHTRF